MNKQPNILRGSLRFGITVVLSLTTFIGFLLAWGILPAIGILIIGIVVIVVGIWIERKNRLELPKSLTSTGFSYPKPDWLLDNDRENISDLAKAAFVLLAFDRTETGFWSKTYLYRRMKEGEKLPLARGALTGTPFAFIAMTSYAKLAENVVNNWAYPPISETLTKIIREGRYVERYTKGFGLGGTTEVPEPSRHAAGACLLTLMFGTPGSLDIKILESLCSKKGELNDYDKATIFRLLLQASYLPAIPNKLLRQIKTRQKKILRNLIESGEKTAPSRIWGRASFGYQEDATNQWGIVWWLLPSVTIPQISLKQRRILQRILRQFLLAQSAAEPTGDNLLPSKVDKSGKGTGKHVFGSTLALVAWRTLELDEFNSPRDKEHAIINAKKMVQRIVSSLPEILQLPSEHPPDNKKALEGYVGWAGLCLAAASIGITISEEDCRKGLSLAQKLNDDVNINDLTKEQLKHKYKGILNKEGFLKPSIAHVTARVASRIAFYYKDVLQNEKEI